MLCVYVFINVWYLCMCKVHVVYMLYVLCTLRMYVMYGMSASNVCMYVRHVCLSVLDLSLYGVLWYLCIYGVYL